VARAKRRGLETETGGIKVQHSTKTLAKSVRTLCVAATFGLAGCALNAQALCGNSYAKAWIEQAFSDAPKRTGAFAKRVEIKTPVHVSAATLTGARVGFSIWQGYDPQDHRAGFTDVAISNLYSHDIYGAAIKTNRKDPSIQLFLADVTIRPNWPHWISYDATNYDGIVLDGAEAFYAQSLTITDWHADSAIDNKAAFSQMVDLTVSGPGNRPLRYWMPGPHYLVEAQIDKPGDGTLIWIRDCTTVSLRVYRSRFNGAPRLSSDQISCETGDAPEVSYLTQDPRNTGEMHPMFRACAGRE